MRVLMIRTALGAPEGHTTETYREGEEYDLPDWLAEAFIADGYATADGEKPPAEPRKGKK